MVENWRPLNDTQADLKLENMSIRCKGECVVKITHGLHSHFVQFVGASSSSKCILEKFIQCNHYVSKNINGKKLAAKTVKKKLYFEQTSNKTMVCATANSRAVELSTRARLGPSSPQGSAIWETLHNGRKQKV